MSKNKMILTGYAHRLKDGVLETAKPGDVAPDWVTNPKILAEKSATGPDLETTTAEPTPPAPAPTGDDLDGLDGKALKAIADELGVAKNGKLTDITDRIRAKRAESVPEPTDRDALAAKAVELGIEVDDNLSEAELQVLIDSKE